MKQFLLDRARNADAACDHDYRLATSFICQLSILCAALLCMASSHAATYSLILGPSIDLGPLQGVPANLDYIPISSIIGDVNGDGVPDVVLGVNGAPPAVYLSNGSSNPFQGVEGSSSQPHPGLMIRR